MNGHRLAAGLLALFAASAAIAAPAPCTPVVEQGWIRAAPPNAQVYAAYAVLHDPCGRTVTVTGARSLLFGAVQMHETRVVGGVSTMRGKGRLVLQAHGELVFAPGGNHLMLMKPVHAMPPEGHVRIDFILGDGRVVPGDFIISRDTPYP
jgi:copper(I)-binding protein